MSRDLEYRAILVIMDALDKFQGSIFGRAINEQNDGSHKESNMLLFLYGMVCRVKCFYIDILVREFLGNKSKMIYIYW